MMVSMKGLWIVRTNEAMTVLFSVTAVLAAIFFEQPWKTIEVTVSLACFSLGIFAFLWGYWTAVQRSRQDNISVAALYFLIDKCAPRSVSVRMNVVLGVQTLVAIVTGIARSSTDGKAGSTLAFGILVPMLGLGLNGLWGATYGSFSPRILEEEPEVPDSDPANRQDNDHD